MKSILSTTSLDSSFSLSKRYFNWKKKKVQEEDDEEEEEEDDDLINNEQKILTRFNFSSDPTRPDQFDTQQITKKKKKKTIERIRYALGFSNSGLGFRVVGTLFGNRRGHVYFAVQDDPTRLPAVLIQLPTPTSVLVKEMASGLVRIALETAAFKTGSKKLLEESTWRTYCNGKKCGYAAKKECGEAEWRVLKAVGPITMGAGVLPAATATVAEDGNEAVGSEKGELMYMRARFERVIGSRDSEAFYMMNPDGSSGGPELSVYFLRV
ncbi:hypothetical protein EUTSA_v10004775mg [Eutrema salsugineum]|uniref:Protein MIZU-KUSSEI 1 n=1 Tax=Eutrema salsugineum TaxID=72664 RepID=V4KNN3_EUTSA|nr:protein MIZU-KUSSEI 1 [Eutrema salsugineum]ESQ32924.1 hypothetical protein EUTSA_v10004775mg [Eutrema salsugineum]